MYIHIKIVHLVESVVTEYSGTSLVHSLLKHCYSSSISAKKVGNFYVQWNFYLLAYGNLLCIFSHVKGIEMYIEL
jgi:hypothetical protein